MDVHASQLDVRRLNRRPVDDAPTSLRRQTPGGKSVESILSPGRPRIPPDRYTQYTQIVDDSNLNCLTQRDEVFLLKDACFIAV